MDVLILGCGFAGKRIARQLLNTGARVTVTSRDPQRLAGLGATAITLSEVPRHLRHGLRVVHSIPPDGPAGLAALLGDAPSRVVYLSSTAVYGSATTVDATTPVDPNGDRARIRLQAEREAAAGPWKTLVLRPAAIYGPGRGAHVSIRRGTYSVGDNVVSRIHVEDLATHVVAGLSSQITGVYPVADDEPCTTRQIAEFCAGLLGLPVPQGQSPGARATGNRRVDGSAIRRALGIDLRYPTYRDGIPAAIADEIL
jgi:nucleoside-diphosphate-sugar epimerase